MSPLLPIPTPARFFTVWAKRSAARLSKGLVLKDDDNVLPCEAEVLKIVASKPGIRAPRVLGSFQFAGDAKYFSTMGYIVMDYISGQSLDSCWEGLGEAEAGTFHDKPPNDTRDAVCETPDPGPICGGPCRGRFFTHYSAGPFKNKTEFEG